VNYPPLNAQYIVRTGLGLADVAISKKAVQWPLQKASVLELVPQSYSFVLGGMSKEKLSFELPVNFTVGPKDEMEHLQAYAIVYPLANAHEYAGF
jgi:hypothetical protein